MNLSPDLKTTSTNHQTQMFQGSIRGFVLYRGDNICHIFLCDCSERIAVTTTIICRKKKRNPPAAGVLGVDHEQTNTDVTVGLNNFFILFLSRPWDITRLILSSSNSGSWSIYSFNFNSGLRKRRTCFCLLRTPSPRGKQFLWFLKIYPLPFHRIYLLFDWSKL